jgi:hypothetical protein
VLSEVLTANLPDSFFHGPTPFDSGDGYTVQVLSSVQVGQQQQQQKQQQQQQQQQQLTAAAAAAAAAVQCTLHRGTCRRA